MANSNHRPGPPLLAATSCRAGFLWRGNTVKLGSAVVNLGENWDNMGLARRTFVQPSSNDHTGGRPRLDSLPRVRDIWSASAGLRYLTRDTWPALAKMLVARTARPDFAEGHNCCHRWSWRGKRPRLPEIKTRGKYAI